MEAADRGGDGDRPARRQDAYDDPDGDAGDEGHAALVARGHHPRQGCGTGDRRDLLPLDQLAAAEDDGQILGF